MDLMTSVDDPALAGFSWEERNILSQVEPCLARGVRIMNWWEWADRTGNITDSFTLTQVTNRNEQSVSFFAEVPFPTYTLPVMGDVPWVDYDQPKARRDLRDWTANVREFALRYFMRISSFELPQAVVQEGASTPPFPLDLISFCPRGYVTQEGFGFQQLFYKLRDTGAIGRFPEAQSFTIIDQRELATRYEWVVAKVRVFDFVLTFPPNPNLPRIGVPLGNLTTQYIIYSNAFVKDYTDPSGAGGLYQFGYAMLQPRYNDSILVYGPGQFSAGFQLFTFTVGDDGRVFVRMPFVVNRPTQILSISVDPLDWAFSVAELLLPGAKSFLEPLHEAFDDLPGRPNLSFDPVFGSIELINLLTLGQAGRTLCISKNDLEKFFLIFHFNQYYTMITGSLLTWRQVRDWTNPADIPEFAKTGRSS
jgi:hypothetical protein